MNTTAALFWAVIGAVGMKPIYYTQMGLIVLASPTTRPRLVWGYTRWELVTLVGWAASLFAVMRLQGLVLGFTAGLLGILYLYAIHVKFWRAAFQTKRAQDA